MALEIHIQILLGTLTNALIPEAPDGHAIHTFEQWFTDACEVDCLLKGSTTFQNGDRSALQSISNLRALTAMDPTSNITIVVSHIEECSLCLIFSTVYSFGLPEWRPDLLGGTPTSLYNGALKSIALWTFEQAATLYAYMHLLPNLCYIQDTAFMQKLYRNFLWSYLRGLALKEQKEWGSVSQALQENKAYKSWSEVMQSKVIYISYILIIVFNSLHDDEMIGCGRMVGMTTCSSWPLMLNAPLTRSQTQMDQGS